VKVDIALYLHIPYDTHLHRVHPNPLLGFNYSVCVYQEPSLKKCSSGRGSNSAPSWLTTGMLCTPSWLQGWGRQLCLS